jgi:F0F1-type ATP synthase assembly protein I
VPGNKTAMRRFLMCQFIVTVCLAIIVGLCWGYDAARATFFGGLLAVIPNIFLSMYLSWRSNSIYVGEMLKIILTGLLLVLLLHFVTVGLAPLLIGLLGTYTVYFFSGFLIK